MTNDEMTNEEIRAGVAQLVFFATNCTNLHEFKEMSSLQKLIAENAESAEIFFNIALRTLRSLR
jgi:hypothetical protein